MCLWNWLQWIKYDKWSLILLPPFLKLTWYTNRLNIYFLRIKTFKWGKYYCDYIVTHTGSRLLTGRLFSSYLHTSYNHYNFVTLYCNHNFLCFIVQYFYLFITTTKYWYTFWLLVSFHNESFFLVLCFYECLAFSNILVKLYCCILLRYI